MELTSGISELQEIITGDLAEVGRWLIASVDTRMSWPVVPQRIVYRGQLLWVLPLTKKHYPGVAFNRPATMLREEAERLIMRFLSALAWIEDGGILVEHFTEGRHVRPLEREKAWGFSIQRDFDFSYLPEPTDEKCQLALAIMREGRGLNHPAYAFLSFYRVLEVALGDGRARGRWMAEQIDQIRSPQAKEIIDQLRAKGIDDIGAHLQKSGRQAIAHAKSKPLIDPDDPADYRRLGSELPIIEALAVRAVDTILGVETRANVWQKHLYELDGFKRIFGTDLVDLIGKGDDVALPDINFPAISVELRMRPVYESLSSLQPVRLVRYGPTVLLLAQSSDECIQFRCQMDFANERLDFDIQDGIGGRDDGTAESADRLADLHRFIYDYLRNGELRILNAETNELLSRKDAFIPVNCFVNSDVCVANIEHWKVIAQARRDLVK